VRKRPGLKIESPDDRGHAGHRFDLEQSRKAEVQPRGPCQREVGRWRRANTVVQGISNVNLPPFAGVLTKALRGLRRSDL
jgi:hypothetical protein